MRQFAPPCSSPERMATVTRSARRLHLARPPHAAATSEVRSRSRQEAAEYPDPEDLQEIHLLVASVSTLAPCAAHLGPQKARLLSFLVNLEAAMTSLEPGPGHCSDRVSPGPSDD